MLRRQVLKSTVAAAFAGRITTQAFASGPVVSSDAISLHWSSGNPSKLSGAVFDPRITTDRLERMFIRDDQETLIARSSTGVITGFCFVYAAQDYLAVFMRSINHRVAETMLDECVRKVHETGLCNRRNGNMSMKIFDCPKTLHDSFTMTDQVARWVQANKHEHGRSRVLFLAGCCLVCWTMSESPCNPTPMHVQAVRVVMEDAIDDYKKDRKHFRKL